MLEELRNQLRISPQLFDKGEQATKADRIHRPDLSEVACCVVVYPNQWMIPNMIFAPPVVNLTDRRKRGAAWQLILLFCRKVDLCSRKEALLL